MVLKIVSFISFLEESRTPYFFRDLPTFTTTTTTYFTTKWKSKYQLQRSLFTDDQNLSALGKGKIILIFYPFLLVTDCWVNKKLAMFYQYVQINRKLRHDEIWSSVIEAALWNWYLLFPLGQPSILSENHG